MSAWLSLEGHVLSSFLFLFSQNVLSTFYTHFSLIPHPRVFGPTFQSTAVLNYEQEDQTDKDGFGRHVYMDNV